MSSLARLFPDVPAEIAESYLEQLLKSNLEQIRLQPSILELEADQVFEELVSVMQTNYTTLLLANEHYERISTQIKEFPDAIDPVLQHFAGIRHAIQDLEEAQRDFVVQCKALDLVKRHASVIAELTEIPSLLDTLVKNEYYEQALELQAFVNRV